MTGRYTVEVEHISKPRASTPFQSLAKASEFARKQTGCRIVRLYKGGTCIAYKQGASERLSWVWPAVFPGR